MGFIEEMVSFLEKKIKKHKKQTRPKSYVLVGSPIEIEMLCVEIESKKEVQVQALQSLVNLCLINKRRQERVINAGILPVLKAFLDPTSAIKTTSAQGALTRRDLAFELLSDMPHASIFCRSQIWNQRYRHYDIGSVNGV